jgi:hypothetical protein
MKNAEQQSSSIFKTDGDPWGWAFSINFSLAKSATGRRATQHRDMMSFATAYSCPSLYAAAATSLEKARIVRPNDPGFSVHRLTSPDMPRTSVPG